MTHKAFLHCKVVYISRSLLKGLFRIADELRLLYEIVNGELNTNRAWWPQAEAALAFEFGWRMTREPVWLERLKEQWRYILRVIADSRAGSEWLNELSEDGASIGKPLVEEWKCPYHNGRMCLRLMSADLPESL